MNLLSYVKSCLLGVCLSCFAGVAEEISLFSTHVIIVIDSLAPILPTLWSAFQGFTWCENRSSSMILSHPVFVKYLSLSNIIATSFLPLHLAWHGC